MVIYLKILGFRFIYLIKKVKIFYITENLKFKNHNIINYISNKSISKLTFV